MKMIIHVFVSSQLNYCNSQFTSLSSSSLDHLQVVQNAAARLLTRPLKRSHATPLLISLHWLPIKCRIHFKILVLTYRVLHGHSPAYISELLRPYATIHPGPGPSGFPIRACSEFLILDSNLKEMLLK
ncbi:hypothetical protein LDENG_00104280 [Lucifuga dentata]|nr:hypothetical protein LDENG_00104280 [Lucifuga dentata]